VGSFAQWNAYEKRTWTIPGGTRSFGAGPYGHVAYVAAVYPDGTVLLEDYNGAGGTRAYGTIRLPKTAVPRYIHYAG
jgi:Surface antigen